MTGGKMKKSCMLLLVLVLSFLLHGKGIATTIVPDNSGYLRMYEENYSNGSVIQHRTNLSPDILTSSTPSVDVDLNAKISPLIPNCCISGHYRTYYKPGDNIALWAQWRPFGDWGVSLSGKELTITYKLSKGSKVIYNWEHKGTLYDGDSGWTGLAPSYTIPETAKSGDVYTFEVTFSVSGINLVDKYKSAPSSTKLYITNEESSDLPIPFLFEFEQKDWEWGEDKLGTCNTTMGKEGCATTSKAFIFRYFSNDGLTPGLLNECLTNNDGYASGCLIPNDNEFNIALKCAPSDVLWEGYYSGSKLSSRIIQSLESAFPVMVKVTQYGALHYYVIIGKRGTDKWNVFDPLDGQIHMMESRGLTNSMIRAVYLYSQW